MCQTCEEASAWTEKVLKWIEDRSEVTDDDLRQLAEYIDRTREQYVDSIPD